jgi:hypothetical protein
MKQAQLISIVVYALLAWWYVAPRLRQLGFAQSLTVLLWIHVFRYCVLYLHVARQEGYAISDAAVTELVVGDVAGALIASLAIVALRLHLRVGLALAWLVIVVTVGDAAAGFYQRSIEAPRADAVGVWWLIFVFFAPAVLVSLPLLGWQLVTRRAQSCWPSPAGRTLVESP